MINLNKFQNQGTINFEGTLVSVLDEEKKYKDAFINEVIENNYHTIDMCEDMFKTQLEIIIEKNFERLTQGKFLRDTLMILGNEITFLIEKNETDESGELILGTEYYRLSVSILLNGIYLEYDDLKEIFE